MFSVSDDPVKVGLVASLARPGGNATGINFFVTELGAKQLGLLRELVPPAVRIGLLLNPSVISPTAETVKRDVMAAAPALGVQIDVLEACSRAALLRDRPSELVELYGSLEDTVRGFGEVEVVTRERYALFRTTRIFADLTVMRDALRLVVHLDREVRAPCFVKVQRGSPKRVAHVTLLRSAPELPRGCAVSGGGLSLGRQRGDGRKSKPAKATEIELTPVPFDLQPSLQGPLVTLRPLSLADHDRLFAVAADPLIWEQHPDKTRFQPAGFQVFFQEALDSGGALLAMESASGQVIGSSRFHGYDEEADEVEIGWTFLARSHWGGQYNREMKRLMLEHAFRYVDRVMFLIDPANLRSQRAIEKIGAVRVGMRAGGSGRTSCVFQIGARR